MWLGGDRDSAFRAPTASQVVFVRAGDRRAAGTIQKGDGLVGWGQWLERDDRKGRRISGFLRTTRRSWT